MFDLKMSQLCEIINKFDGWKYRKQMVWIELCRCEHKLTAHWLVNKRIKLSVPFNTRWCYKLILLFFCHCDTDKMVYSNVKQWLIHNFNHMSINKHLLSHFVKLKVFVLLSLTFQSKVIKKSTIQTPQRKLVILKIVFWWPLFEQ